MISRIHNTTLSEEVLATVTGKTTVLLLQQPFYGSLDFVRDKPGEPVSEETFTHVMEFGEAI